jgi:3-mercaptopyruvate sulfurtransferase SseA
MERGFKRVRPLAGGLDAWVEAGYETRGEDPRESTLPVRSAS